MIEQMAILMFVEAGSRSRDWYRASNHRRAIWRRKATEELGYIFCPGM